MTTQETGRNPVEREATPRPWFRQSFGDHHLIHGPDQGGIDVGALAIEATATEANTRLIVEAVNNYDRLRAVEAAAREAEAAYSARPDTDERDHPEGLTHEQVNAAWELWDIRQQKALAALREALQVQENRHG